MDSYTTKDFVEFFKNNPTKFVKVCKELPSKSTEYEYIEYSNNDGCEPYHHTLETEYGDKDCDDKFYDSIDSVKNIKYLDNLLTECRHYKGLDIEISRSEYDEEKYNEYLEYNIDMYNEIEKLDEELQSYFAGIEVRTMKFDPIKLISVYNIKK